eukprot:Gb_27195 [translate_table: standard]
MSNRRLETGERGERKLSTAAAEGGNRSFVYRHRFLWSGLLLLNIAVGGYLLGTKKKTADSDNVEEKVPDVKENTVVTETKDQALPSISALSPSQQITEEEQRQLFKWMLEEKRKVKTTSPAERNRIDKEKTILKQFLRSKEIPTF